MKEPDTDTVDLKEIKGQTIKLYRKVSQKRFKLLPNGYEIDRWLFQISMFMIFAWLLFVAYSYDLDLDFYECLDPNPHYESGLTCKNPFYKEADWKNQKFLPVGEYGHKPGPLFKSVFYMPFVLFIIAGVLNHLIHNRSRWS